MVYIHSIIAIFAFFFSRMFVLVFFSINMFFRYAQSLLNAQLLSSVMNE